jgi:hypothetical protein
METTHSIKDLMAGAIKQSTITQASQVTGWEPNIDDYESSLKAAKAACSRFVADMERETVPYWLTLQGVNGCGKTMLLRQVFEQAKRINPGNPVNNRIWPPNWDQFGPNSVNVYTDARPYCMKFDESSLASLMRNGDFELPRNCRNDYFVVLDEIGAARDPTNFVADAVAQLCENRVGRWSMFATNLTLDEIAQRMDARISSRIIRDGNTFIAIKARDYALHHGA